ncbi:MAG: MoxR family ATPase [Planctomycetota bacterium]|nr:MoxR family ATPase [Planctomycetota bacterium]
MKEKADRQAPGRPDKEGLKAQLEAFRADFERMRSEIAKMIVGYGDQVEKVLVAMIAGGNVLLEGVPGLGKTMLVRTMGEALALDFRRVQFTPDLMPADIIGTNIVGEDGGGGRTLRFQRGPLFTHLLLADEINRATPRTQSALLEAMEEHTVTVAGKTYVLEEPFFVMATQNPVEQAGTYPLPAAQLDKFLFKLIVGFPNAEELDAIVLRTTTQKAPEIATVTTREKILEMRALAARVPVPSHVERYAGLLVMATNPASDFSTDASRRLIQTGASPRGMLGMLAAARIRALLNGRTQTAVEDIKAMAVAALRHRVVRSFEAESEGIKTDQIVEQVVAAVDEQHQAVFAQAS